MNKTILAKRLVASCGGRVLAYFDQVNDINRFLSQQREKLSDQKYSHLFNSVWRGVCYVLSTRFIIQSIKGLPPLGMDLEKLEQQDNKMSLFLVPENSQLFHRFPHLRHRSLPVSEFVADQYVTSGSGEGTLFPAVDAWLKNQGFVRRRIPGTVGFPGGAGGGIHLAYQMRDWGDWLLENHGFGLLSLFKGDRGHCFVFHTGPSGEWMFLDVNYGWFLFPTYVHFEVFLACFWFETEYDFPTACALDTFKRV